MLRVVAIAAISIASVGTARAMPDPPPPEDYVPPPPPPTPQLPVEPLPPDLPPPSAAPLPPPASTATTPVYVPVYGPLPAPGLPPTPAREREYGWKVMLSDGLALGLVLAAVASEPPQRDPSTDQRDDEGLSGAAIIAILGVGWWSTITPLVHLTEGNGPSAAWSYGLRYTLPLAGALIGHSFDRPDSTSDSGALWGLAAGALAASVIDVTWLSHRTERGGALWMPTFTASSSTYRIGIGRSF